MKPIDWQVTARDGEARAGILRTRRSIIETPVFMPVGMETGTTDGYRLVQTVELRSRDVAKVGRIARESTELIRQGVRFESLEDELDARIVLGNTYHLFLRPGPEIIRGLGGLHKFSTWNRSLLTDSGGFQVFSLTDLRKLSEDGVEFRSHTSRPRSRWRCRPRSAPRS